MIPKIIHYCWFGKNEKSRNVKKCISSWKKYCPDYEIIEWNEENFDILYNEYTKKCYIEHKYAFLTDYIRLLVLEKYGGIYFDTDVELCKNLDFLLDTSAYIGFETNQYVNTGMGVASEPHGKMIKLMLEEYQPLLDGQHGVIGCPILNTQALLKLGLKQNGKLQKLADVTVYPIEWFNPYDDATGILRKTPNTVSIHWYSKSWMSKYKVIRSYFTKPIHRIQNWMKGIKRE